MAMQNLASKYSRSVDERFHRESQAMMALNNNYKFTGVQTVQVYSLPVVAMNDYQRTGSSRYGQANDLSTNVQTMTVKRDRAFTFIIDKGDKIQSQMVSDAGKALSRQLREVCVPEFDAYVFKTLAAAATAMQGCILRKMVEVAGFEPATAISRSRLRVWCIQPLYKTSKKVSGSGGGTRTRNDYF